MSQRKFAFIGTSCTGKTTLLHALEQSLGPSAVFVPEAARQYFESNATSVEFSEASQASIQQLALQNEQRAHTINTDLIVCDRSVIDPAVYCHVMIGPDAGRRLYQQIEQWVSTYTTFFLLDPNGVPFKQDVVRQESAAIRDKLHQGFLTVLKKNQIQYTLLSGDIEARTKRAIQIMHQ